MADERVREITSGLVSVRQWSDPDEPGIEGHYPWPDDHTEFAPPESLRDAILARLGRSDGSVSIVETISYGGYSEYTQEHYYDFVVMVDGAEVFQSGSDYESDNNLVALLKWLDGAA